MTEKSLRQLHRTAGVPLALFVVLQSVTGIVLAIENLFAKYWGGQVHTLHFGFGLAGGVGGLVDYDVTQLGAKM